MKLIVHEGRVWKLTETRYRQLRRQLVSDSGAFDLDTLGVCLGEVISILQLRAVIADLRSPAAAFGED